MVAHVQAVHGVSKRRGRMVLGINRSLIRYVSHRPDQTALMLRIRDLAATRTRYGYVRITILLRREGWFVNQKRAYRLYRQDGLSLRLKASLSKVKGGRGTTSALPTVSGNQRHRQQMRCGRWTSSRTRCLTVDG